MHSRRIEDPVSFLIHRLSRSVMRASMAYYLQEFGLGVPQVQILHSIGSHGPLVSKDIADYIAMNKALVSRSLSELSARGYAENTSDASDARRRVWTLTPKGKEFVAMCRPIRLERRAKLLKVLTQEEREIFVGVLQRLYESSENLRAEEAVMLAQRRRAKAKTPKAKPAKAKRKLAKLTRTQARAA